MPGWKTEEVLVVPRDLVFPDGAWHGFIATDLNRYLEIISTQFEFKKRGDVEDDPAFQQIIPYVVFRHGDRYFLTKRLKESSEKRLRHLFSLGIGGHINRADISDRPGADPVIEGLRREFEEEVSYEGNWTHRMIGLLNDDSNDVSRVHLAVVFEVTGDRPGIAIRETGKLDGELLSLEEMKIYYLDMESWSQLIYDYLLAREKAAAAAGGAQ